MTTKITVWTASSPHELELTSDMDPVQYQQRQIGFLTIKPGCGTIGALAFQQAIIAATATVLSASTTPLSLALLGTTAEAPATTRAAPARADCLRRPSAP